MNDIFIQITDLSETPLSTFKNEAFWSDLDEPMIMFFFLEHFSSNSSTAIFNALGANHSSLKGLFVLTPNKIHTLKGKFATLASWQDLKFQKMQSH